MNIAIIGAGLSGCFLYRSLKKKNYNVTIFEKSRGTGGRLSTKYIENRFCDHGASFLETRNKKFIRFCQELVTKDILVKKNDTYYPTQGINKVCSSLINRNDLINKCKIKACKKEKNSWQLIDTNDKIYKNFNTIIFTIPAPQILELQMNLEEKIKNDLKKVSYESIATLIVYNKKFIDYDEEICKKEFFRKIINNSKKYNYEDFYSMVFHSKNNPFEENKNLKKEQLEDLLLSKSGIKNIQECNFITHFWKYAIVKNSLDYSYIFDKKNNLAFASDYFNTKNLEASFNSCIKLLENF